MESAKNLGINALSIAFCEYISGIIRTEIKRNICPNSFELVIILF